LKNNTEVTNSKCYAFASSALLRLFFTSNFKINDIYLAPPKLFSPSWLCWAGYGPALTPSEISILLPFYLYWVMI